MVGRCDGERVSVLRLLSSAFFFFNDTATTEIYTLSLHDALPISVPLADFEKLTKIPILITLGDYRSEEHTSELQSPYVTSYAVFCLKKKTTPRTTRALAPARRPSTAHSSARQP